MKLLIKTLCISLLWLLPSIPFTLRAGPIVINASNVYNFAKDSWNYFACNDSTTSVYSIVNAYGKGVFRPVGHEVYNGGIAKKYLWFEFLVVNSEATDNFLMVDVESPRINQLELFELSDSGVHSLGRCGDFFTFNQRVTIHKNFVFPIHLPAKASRTYFLYVNQVGHTLILPVRLYKSNVFPTIAFQSYLVDGVTYGVLLFVAILSLIFFFNTFHYLYLFYGLYIFTAVAWFLSYFGLGYQYLWGAHPFVSTLSAPLYASLNLLLNIQICQLLLRLRQVDPSLHAWGNIAKVMLAAAGLFPVVVNLNKQGYGVNNAYLLIFLTIVIFSVFVVVFSVISYSLRGLMAARFYLIASLLKIGSIFNLALLELGITPGVYNMEGLLQAGIVIEIAMLAGAIANRYTLYKIKSYKQVIMAQESEREIISREIHDNISNTLSGIKYAFINVMKTGECLPETIATKLLAVSNQISRVQKDARSISHYMMPDYIVHYPLTTIIQMYVDEMSERVSEKNDCLQTPTINFSYNEQPGSFSHAVKVAIFRIIQELISNIYKHSMATSAEIVLSFERKTLLIICEDDGLGITTEGLDSSGVGVNNIRSRVKTLNGSLRISPRNINNHPQQRPGTVIIIRIPFRGNLLQKTTSYDY